MFLEIDNLTKRFGGLTAVSSVSFSMGQREIIGIFGPNGSGKTTLLNLLSGLLTPTSGRVVWQGRDIAGTQPNAIASAGVVKTFQNPQLFAELSVFEHVMIASYLSFTRMPQVNWLKTFFFPTRVEHELRARADKVLKLCRLDGVKDKTASELSYGEEKMLGVAMAMMCDPQLLLLDEPASGLGKNEIANLGNVLRDLRDHGVALCIIDHKVAFLAEFADRAIALQNGCKIAEGPPDAVLADPGVVKAYLGHKHARA